jgi:hypothetical protein
LWSENVPTFENIFFDWKQEVGVEEEAGLALARLTLGLNAGGHRCG